MIFTEGKNVFSFVTMERKEIRATWHQLQVKELIGSIDDSQNR